MKHLAMHLLKLSVAVNLLLFTTSCASQIRVWDIRSYSYSEIFDNGKWSAWSNPKTGYSGSVVKFGVEKDLIVIEAGETKFMRIINRREVTFDSHYNPIFGFDCVDEESKRCLIKMVHDTDQMSHFTIEYPIIKFKYGLVAR